MDWSLEEEKFLKENYSSSSKEELEQALDRNISSIAKKAYKLGLKKAIYKKFSDKEFLEAIKNSKSHFEAGQKLGLKTAATISYQYKRLLNKLQPDTSHFSLRSRCFSKNRNFSILEAKLNRDKNNAKIRGLSFDLSISKYEELSFGKCFYCGKQGNSLARRYSKDIYVCGIDRVDNNLGYSEENCVGCCWECNEMKKAKTKEHFLEKIKNIYENLKLGEK